MLKRYRGIVDDWEGLIQSVNEPLPTSIWVNPFRSTRSNLVNWLQSLHVKCEIQKWNDIGILISGGFNPGLGLPFLLGHYHIQEEVSMLPVYLSEVWNHSRLLDLCAAPGNKTVLASVLMQENGDIVGNDRSSARLQILKRAMARLGLGNISICAQNAGRFQYGEDPFDLIFADVPCSCEGTLRKNKNLFYELTPYSASLISTQRFILGRAMDLCPKNGQIVYSTCTFAPEENESNLNWALQRGRGKFRIKPVTVPENFQYSKGIRFWEGVEFSLELENCIRVWPHENNTGGFFVGVLERVDD